MLDEQFNGMMESTGLGHLDRNGEQWKQMRRAFFGGAAIAMSILEEVADLPEEEAMVVIHSLETETDNFVAGLELGIN